MRIFASSIMICCAVLALTTSLVAEETPEEASELVESQSSPGTENSSKESAREPPKVEAAGEDSESPKNGEKSPDQFPKVEGLPDVKSEEQPQPNPAAAYLNILTIGARLDTAASISSPTYQGFSIPSIRLTAFGRTIPQVDYRLSLGQTREYSSVLLPQILPVEAYIDLFPNRILVEEESVRFRIGMFTPLFNPWWTPDLSEIPFPDYQTTHSALFISRDIGAEVTLPLLPEQLKLSLGIVNGNGIFGLNTNSSKAVTAQVVATFPIENSKIKFGWGGYTLKQATQGSVNYKSNWVSNFFASFESATVLLSGEASFARFTDSTRAVTPFGTAGALRVKLLESFFVFIRGESLVNPPSGASGLNRIQAGPILTIGDSLSVYGFFNHLRVGSSNQRSGELRFRLTI